MNHYYIKGKHQVFIYSPLNNREQSRPLPFLESISTLAKCSGSLALLWEMIPLDFQLSQLPDSHSMDN